MYVIWCCLHLKVQVLLRIGKSQLCNLYHVAKLKSLPNSRLEITLKNKERLIASRHYSQNLKEMLGVLE
ncbi:MAG: LytTR family transcriptional regulator [Clostridiaceae bacterium]|nr:LytTR family transcriptional regulator [Clostridiaceae bacterium]